MFFLENTLNFILFLIQKKNWLLAVAIKCLNVRIVYWEVAIFHYVYYYSFTESPPLSSPVEVQHHKQTIHLWQFLKDLLLRPDRYNSCIKWVDRQRGIFKIEDSSKVAKLWGLRKNRPAMNYDKLSRSIRQYYKKGIIKKTEHSKRLVYQFCQPYLWTLLWKQLFG